VVDKADLFRIFPEPGDEFFAVNCFVIPLVFPIGFFFFLGKIIDEGKVGVTLFVQFLCEATANETCGAGYDYHIEGLKD
jgi:hypothetical protein